MRLIPAFILLAAGLLAYRSGQLHTPRNGGRRSFTWLWRMLVAIALGVVGLAMAGCATNGGKTRIEASAEAKQDHPAVARATFYWEISK